MTMAQFKKSVINMENYALFVFDMVDIPHGIIDSECYDPIEENMTRRVSVFTDIGNINKGLFDCINNINRCPTSIDLSGAKVRIPIDMLKQQLSLDKFCEDISHRILLLIN